MSRRSRQGSTASRGSRSPRAPARGAARRQRRDRRRRRSGSRRRYRQRPASRPAPDGPARPSLTSAWPAGPAPARRCSAPSWGQARLAGASSCPHDHWLRPAARSPATAPDPAVPAASSRPRGPSPPAAQCPGRPRTAAPRPRRGSSHPVRSAATRTAHHRAGLQVPARSSRARESSHPRLSCDPRSMARNAGGTVITQMSPSQRSTLSPARCATAGPERTLLQSEGSFRALARPRPPAQTVS